MLFVIYCFLAFLLGGHHHSDAKEECTKAQGNCPAAVVPAPYWSGHFDQRQTSESFPSPEQPPFKRRQVLEPHQVSHGDFRPMALQVLHAYGESYNGALWRMPRTLECMRGQYLYPQAAQEGEADATRIRRLLDTISMGRRQRTLETKSSEAVTASEDAVSTTSEWKCPFQNKTDVSLRPSAGPHEGQGSWQRQARRKGWSSCLWTLASFYTVAQSSGPAFHGNSHDNSLISLCGYAALWKTSIGQGRSRADCFEEFSHFCPRTLHGSTRGSEESPCSRRSLERTTRKATANW